MEGVECKTILLQSALSVSLSSLGILLAQEHVLCSEMWPVLESLSIQTYHFGSLIRFPFTVIYLYTVYITLYNQKTKTWF